MLRALVRTAPSAVAVLDIDGRITMLSPGAERLFGATAYGTVGRSYHEVFGPSLADRVLRLFLRAARRGESAEPELIHAALPGRDHVALRASVGPVRDAGGELVGVIFVGDEDDPTGPPSDPAVTGRLREALRRYLGDEIAATVERRPSFIGVGGVRREVSLLHADIRGYTSAAESLEPEAVASLLLRYHGSAVRALQNEGATLDRFIGDSVLAIWNAPVGRPDHARAAIRGALALQAAARDAGDELSYGVGVHSGEAVVGNVGTEDFLNYTAVGDTVNVAARLQSQAGKGEVVCSGRALRDAGAGVRSEPLGLLSVKGRRSRVEAHRVLALEPLEGMP